MTDERLRELRALVRAGELPLDLHRELRGVAQRMARLRLLPPSLAPYGVWNEEAAEDAFADWYADRLLGRGHLQAILDRARTVGALRRLAQRSLRQHLLNARDRSQSQNLYRRVIDLLASEQFVVVRDSAKAQDRWYARAGTDVREWQGRDRDLAAAAWSLGDLTVIRYRADAAKLSPVLDAAELERFVAGIMDRVGAALTPRLIMEALSARLDLGTVATVALEEAPPIAVDDRNAERIVVEETARAVLAALSPRQREVLRASGETPVADMGTALGCSPATIINEQRRIAEVIGRLSEDDRERDKLLNVARDLVYLEDDA